MHTNIHTYIHTHTYLPTCTYLPACMQACIHTYIHAYMHIYIHTYIHTYTDLGHLSKPIRIQYLQFKYRKLTYKYFEHANRKDNVHP